MTETTPQKTSGLVEHVGRYPCMDGLRALAAAIIIVHHVALFTGTGGGVVGEFLARGDVGLAIFFQVSGFLLYRPFVSAHVRGRPHPRLGAYLTRRFLRIFPGFWFAMLAVMLVLRTAHDWSAQATIARFTLSQVYFPDLLASRDGILLAGIGQAWSLNVELLFYLFLPVFAWVMRAVARRGGYTAKVELAGIAALVAGGLVTLWLSYGAGIGTWERFVALPKALTYLGLGMFLAWSSTRPRLARVFEKVAARPAVCWGLAALLFAITATQLDLDVAFGEITGRRPQMARDVLEDLTAFLLLLPAVFGDQGVSGVRHFLRHPVVAWLGTVSYGLYLWHVDLLHRYLAWFTPTGSGPNYFVTLGSVLAATVAAAALSYYVVERPALRLKHRVPLG